MSLFILFIIIKWNAFLLLRDLLFKIKYEFNLIPIKILRISKSRKVVTEFNAKKAENFNLKFHKGIKNIKF